MEPLRPLIDTKVAKMAPIQFEREEKMQLVELLNNTVIIDGQRQYLLLAIRIYCAGLLKALQKNKLSEIKWINYASMPKEKHPADIDLGVRRSGKIEAILCKPYRLTLLRKTALGKIQ